MNKKLLLFTNRLKVLIKENELNIYSFSQKLHCQDQTVTNWINGKYFPRYDMLIKLAKYFNCSIDYILGLTDNPVFKPANNCVSFLTRYQYCLRANGVTSYYVAKVCRISNPATTQWVKHNKIPETGKLIVLAKYFECSVDFLTGITDEFLLSNC